MSDTIAVGVKVQARRPSERKRALAIPLQGGGKKRTGDILGVVHAQVTACGSLPSSSETWLCGRNSARSHLA